MKLRGGLEQHLQPLLGRIRRCRRHNLHRLTLDLGQGPEQLRIHTVVHDGDAAGVDTEVGDNIGAGGTGYRYHPIQLTGHPGLHGEEIMPAPDQQASEKTALTGQSQAPVPGNGVMDGGHQRHTRPLDIENAVRQGLVVVDHVKIPGPGQQPVPGPLTEGPGLDKAPGQLAEPLPSGQRVPQQLAGPGRLQAVGIEVEAGQFLQHHTVIKIGIRGTGHHGDLVALAP